MDITNYNITQYYMHYLVVFNSIILKDIHYYSIFNAIPYNDFYAYSAWQRGYQHWQNFSTLVFVFSDRQICGQNTTDRRSNLRA